MSYEGRRDGRIDPRHALPVVLRDIHRQGCLNVIQALGWTMTEWDEAGLYDLPDEATQFIRFDLVNYDAPAIELDEPLIGKHSLRIRSSSMPVDAAVRSIDPGIDKIQAGLMSINSPAKKIEVEFETNTDAPWFDVSDAGYVITLPDSPPVIVGMRYLAETMYTDTDDNGRSVCHQDSDLLERVEKRFGSDAIVPVPARVCGAILDTLQDSRAWNAVEPILKHKPHSSR